MSETSPSTDSIVPQSPRDMLSHAARDPAPDPENALELCLQAVASDTDEAQRWDVLEELEILLPALGTNEITDLLSEPGYRAIRGQLLRVRAQTWFTHECELARQALAHDASSALRNLFGDHIPREAYADELAMLQPLAPRRILILGSGACPMSAVVIQDAFPNSTVVGLDRSEEACTLSARLLATSGYKAIKIQHGDARNPADIGEFDCVIMALCVGVDEADKRHILRELKTHANPDTILAVRTAVDWGRVLYPCVDLPEIADKAASQSACTSQQRSVAVPIRMDELRV